MANTYRRACNVAVALLVGVATAAVPLLVLADGKWWIRAKPAVTGPFTVEAEITTNIPGNIVLSANLHLPGQKGKDIFIGTEFVRVPITGGKGRVVIDGQKSAAPSGSTLPRATYDLEVAFYPRWSENSPTASKLGIKDPIEFKTAVKLQASGGSVAAAKARQEGQKWVALNVSMGTPWVPSFWKRKFGPWREVPYRGDLYRDTLHMYYFESIDMTLMVDVLKQEIWAWRMGLANE